MEKVGGSAAAADDAAQVQGKPQALRPQPRWNAYV